jgi:hypothetical protein
MISIVIIRMVEVHQKDFRAALEEYVNQSYFQVTWIKFYFDFSLKSCSNGKCIADPNAPTTCIHGDDVVYRTDLNNLVTFNTLFATCDTAINTMIANGIDHVYMCQLDLFSFKSKCCKTCPSNNQKYFSDIN